MRLDFGWLNKRFNAIRHDHKITMSIHIQNGDLRVGGVNTCGYQATRVIELFDLGMAHTDILAPLIEAVIGEIQDKMEAP